MAVEFLNKWNDDLVSLLSEDGREITASLAKERKKSYQDFNQYGIPTIKHEEWKYTPLNFLHTVPFNPVIDRKPTSYGDNISDFVDSYKVSDKANLLVFINGIFSEQLSSIRTKLINGMFIGSLAAAFDKGFITSDDLKADSVKSDIPFNNLNQSFFLDGACIVIPDNTLVGNEFHLMFINSGTATQNLINPRNLIAIGESSDAKVIETYHNISDNPTLINVATIIKCGSRSELAYFKFQNDYSELYQITSTNVVQEKDSIFHSHTITLNGKFTRNNLSTLFNGERCEANFNGLYFLDNNNFVDNHTHVDNANANCNSNEMYKGILDNRSTAVFNGKILVRHEAPKTNAYQSNKNVLLSDDCTVNTKPQLEIFNDDVRCSHGATSGSLDDESMFYLKSRGIPGTKARALLLYAFASEIIEKIEITGLKDYIRTQISKRLNLEDLLQLNSVLID